MANEKSSENGIWERREAVTGESTLLVSMGRILTISVEANGGTFDIIGYQGPRSAASRFKSVLYAAQTTDQIKTSVSGWNEIGVEVTAGNVNFEVSQAPK